MNEWGVFLVITTLMGFVGTAYTMFYKPTHELKIEIVKLISSLAVLNASDEKQNDKIEENTNKLNDHEKRISIIENTHYVKERN